MLFGLEVEFFLEAFQVLLGALNRVIVTLALMLGAGVTVMHFVLVVVGGGQQRGGQQA